MIDTLIYLTGVLVWISVAGVIGLMIVAALREKHRLAAIEQQRLAAVEDTRASMQRAMLRAVADRDRAAVRSITERTGRATGTTQPAPLPPSIGMDLV